MQILRIPFGKGLDQRTDDRLNVPERPRATTNLQRDKEGRLVPRPGYDALGTGLDTSAVVAGSAFLVDIYSYRGDRLVGIGYGTGSGALPRPARPTDLFEHRTDLGNGIDWRQTDGDYQARLCSVTHLRNMPGLPAQSSSVTLIDVAAGNGLVATVHNAGSSSIFHLIDADSGRTVHVEKITGTSARVVCISGTFFVSAEVDSSTDIALWRYNPASDTALTSITNALTGSTTISESDMAMNQAGDGFTVVFRVAAGNATIRLFDSSGAQAQEITTSVSSGNHKVLSQADRTHLVTNASGTITLNTYEHSGGTLENTTDVITGGDSSSPYAIVALVTETPNDERVVVGARKDSGVEFSSLEPDTHANEVTMFWHNCDTATNMLGNQQGVEFDQLIWGGSYQEGVFSAAPSNSSNFLGAMQVTLGPQRIEAYQERLTAGTPSNNEPLPDIAYDVSTGKAYWARIAVDEGGNGKPTLSEFTPHSTDRRQAVELGGALYFSGGFVQYYDGVQLVDAAFAETPRIITAAASNGSGTLTADGVYQSSAVWQREDALRNVQTSAPAEIVETTLSGTDDTLVVTTTTPHSPDRSSTNDEYGGTVKTVVFTTSDTNTNGGDPSLHRSVSTLLNPTSSVEFGEESALTIGGPDTTIEERAFIYTQADDGIISGSLPYDAPRPCSALAVSADRITSVGLPDASELQESMPLFPRRALTWSDSIAFRRSAHNELLAVSRQDERRFAFTRDGIVSFSGPGLDPNGNGDIGAPQALPSDVGLQGGKLGWRSIVEWAKGTMFQGTDGLIYNLPRGGGAPEAVGEMVQDLLATYPNITSATLDRAAQKIRFTCNNVAEDAAIVLVYDTVDGEWFSETFSSPITSAAMYGDRYCIVIAGVVYMQRASGSATFIATSWDSSWIRPNEPGGWISLHKLIFYGEMLGDFTITPTISFPDGTSETLAAKTVSTSAGADLQRAAGVEVTLEWTPNRVQCESFRVDWDVTALSGAVTRGVAYTFWGVEYESHTKGAMRNEEEIA